MNFPILVIDGVLLITFLVGWVEATGSFYYRWTFARFLRAISVPLILSLSLHAAWTLGAGLLLIPLLAPLASPNVPIVLKIVLWPVSLAGFMALIGLGLPLTVVRLAEFVADQFAPAFIEPDL